VIATDTNLLVYAHRRDSPWHQAAADSILFLAEGRQGWGIPWPCLHEFFAIVTHPRIYDPPSATEQAAEQIDAWLESPVLVLLGEARDHWSILKSLLGAGQVRGPLVHDARVASICIAHGVTELWSADRDFGRFPRLSVRNPLAER